MRAQTSARVLGTLTVGCLVSFGGGASCGDNAAPADSGSSGEDLAVAVDMTAGGDLAHAAVCPAAPIPALQHPRIYASAVFVGTELYVFGGVGGTDSKKVPIPQVEMYDAEKKTWTDVTTLPVARGGMAAGVLGDTVVLIGGFDPVSNRVDRYDARANTWSVGAPMPAANCNLTSTTVGNEVFVPGGFDGHNVNNAMVIYDIAGDRWRTGKPMPSARDRAASSALGLAPTIYVAGGQAFGANQFITVEAYDVVKDTWSAVPHLLQARSNHTMATIGDRLYVMGGSYKGATVFVDTVEVYRPGDAAWSEGTRLGGGLRDMASAATCGGSVYLVGGRDPQAVPVGTVQVYTP